MVERSIPERLARAGAPSPRPLASTRRSHGSGAQRPKISEYALHRSVAALLDATLLPPALWTTFPAGWGQLTPAMAGMLYACGLKRGMPDILVFPGFGRVLGIELKAPGGRLSGVQTEMIHKLQQACVPCYIAQSPDDVLAILVKENVSIRRTRLI